MKLFLTAFHLVLLILLLILVFADPGGILLAALLPIFLTVIIIYFLKNESRLILIPSILLIFIFTFAFALMTVGNISWSRSTINLVILFYLLFLGLEILTIVYALKSFRKQI